MIAYNVNPKISNVITQNKVPLEEYIAEEGALRACIRLIRGTGPKTYWEVKEHLQADYRNVVITRMWRYALQTKTLLPMK